VTADENSRLCGGTFFVLVLQALKQRVKARQHYKGERDGLSDPEVLIGLIKVINPDYQEPKEGALKGKTNDFKSCKTSTGYYLPFGNTPEIETFDKRVQNEYPNALMAMLKFISEFLETGTSVKKDVRLVKALIDLIQQDDSINPNDEFFVCEDGGKIKKAALGGLQKVCFPAFLLGVWHYVVVYRKDNTVGKNTYDGWCPENGGASRTYLGNMGRRITAHMSVYMPSLSGPDEQVRDNSDEEPRSAGFATEEQKSETPPPSQQVINNPLFIQQNGGGNAVIPNYGTLNLTIGKRGGGSDE
jgi:hypothetical protein